MEYLDNPVTAPYNFFNLDRVVRWLLGFGANVYFVDSTAGADSVRNPDAGVPGDFNQPYQTILAAITDILAEGGSQLRTLILSPNTHSISSAITVDSFDLNIIGLGQPQLDITNTLTFDGRIARIDNVDIGGTNPVGIIGGGSLEVIRTNTDRGTNTIENNGSTLIVRDGNHNDIGTSGVGSTSDIRVENLGILDVGTDSVVNFDGRILTNITIADGGKLKANLATTPASIPVTSTGDTEVSLRGNKITFEANGSSINTAKIDVDELNTSGTSTSEKGNFNCITLGDGDLRGDYFAGEIIGTVAPTGGNLRLNGGLIKSTATIDGSAADIIISGVTKDPLATISKEVSGLYKEASVSINREPIGEQLIEYATWIPGTVTPFVLTPFSGVNTWFMTGGAGEDMFFRIFITKLYIVGRQIFLRLPYFTTPIVLPNLDLTHTIKLEDPSLAPIGTSVDSSGGPLTLPNSTISNVSIYYDIPLTDSIGRIGTTPVGGAGQIITVHITEGGAGGGSGYFTDMGNNTATVIC